jgi:hypothetical protein
MEDSTAQKNIPSLYESGATRVGQLKFPLSV